VPVSPVYCKKIRLHLEEIDFEVRLFGCVFLV